MHGGVFQVNACLEEKGEQQDNPNNQWLLTNHPDQYFPLRIFVLSIISIDKLY
jgi:hypothetical protein